MKSCNSETDLRAVLCHSRVQRDNAPDYCCIGVTFNAADLGPVYMGTNHHKERKKKRKKNASHKHIILKILILFVPDETVVDSNLQNCSKCVFSCCSKCVFAARVLLCADVTFQQVAKTQERRQRISGDVWRRQ